MKTLSEVKMKVFIATRSSSSRNSRPLPTAFSSNH
jgi:hypothetical protein